MENVILIGFMGCGKSTVGLRLSYRLRRTIVDTDKEIEKEEKRTISDIFATDGEAYFRNLETDCLRKLNDSAGNQIISVGGGLPVREENRALLHELGQVFYLRAEGETIYERVKDDKTAFASGRSADENKDAHRGERSLLQSGGGCSNHCGW